MAAREELIVGAVTFLQDPAVAGSLLESKIKFLQSKNLTQEEIDLALARAGADPAPSYPNYALQQQVPRPPQPAYGGYQQYQWQQPPPELPKRDWRDWFIMATVMGGVGYGLYFVAKRYVIPIIAPPTEPQLQEDKKAIDDSFEKAFVLLDQLAKDTEALKASEEARTERLDTALTEVEKVIGELKTASRSRETESQRITDEVRGLKDLIPKAMEGQKETTDIRLKELNTELKSLKTLMGQRMNMPAAAQSTTSFARATGASTPLGTAPQATSNVNETSTADGAASPATVSSPPTNALTPLQARNAVRLPTSRAAIPAWQMAAANKSSTSVSSVATGSGPQDQVDGA